MLRETKEKMRYLFFALRPTQWIKNIFLFVPLIFGKKLFVFPNNLKSVVAFFIFSLAAGVVYLMNDLLDFKKDSQHPTKCLRPIAAGKVSIRQAQGAAFILSVLSIVSSFMLNIYFGWVIISYLIFNFIYTKFLKEIVIIDMFALAGFFLLRLMGGCVIVEVTMSHWVIFMTFLLAFFLGFNKRRQELILLGEEAISYRSVLRRYNIHYIDKTVAIVTTLMVISYIIYTIDPRTVMAFGTRRLIYSVPFVCCGIFRYLYLIHKLNKDGDPTHMLLSDTIMKVNLVAWVIGCIVVIYFGG